jgi:hypothetical protein
MQLTEHKGAGMQARFYIDGVRVSRERYENVEQQGYMFGTVDTFHTKGAPIGTKTRRTNYKTVRI